MITDKQKREIVQAAKAYMIVKKVSQNQLARVAELIPAYVSDMMNGKLTTGTKNTPIKDQYFQKLANAVGYQLTKGLWWHIDTANYIKIANALHDGRADKMVRAVDGDTGLGKSEAIEQMMRENPVNTYCVECAGDQTAKSFIETVARSMDIKVAGNQYNLRRNISKKLLQEMDSQLIIDEAENLKDAAYASIKGIMDDVKGKSSIVLIGANEYQAHITKLADKNKTPFPQINRRIKEGGFIKLNKWSKSDLIDMDVISILQKTCKNMGELRGAIIKLKTEMLNNPSATLFELSEILLAA